MNRVPVRRSAFLVILAAALIAGVSPSAQTSPAAPIDAILEAPIKDGKIAGASVAVVKGGTTLLMKEYGFCGSRARRPDTSESDLRNWLGDQAVHRGCHPAPC